MEKSGMEMSGKDEIHRRMIGYGDFMIINLTKLLECSLRVSFLSPPEYGSTGWVGNLSNDKTTQEEEYSFELETERLN